LFRRELGDGSDCFYALRILPLSRGIHARIDLGLPRIDLGLLNAYPLGELHARLSEIEETGSRLDEWLLYCRTVSKAKALGLTALVELLESGDLPAQSAKDCFLLAFYRERVKALLKEKETLGGFSRVSYENTRKRFQQLDRQVQELTRKDLAFRIRNRTVPLGRTGAPKDKTGYHLLEHEVGKQKRHIPIRQLMSRAGEALKALKPCFMMSPLSVAQYLEPGRQTFDLVIMDEASQLRPEDALGAIARAKQIVVVGDPNQLPPTTFFERIGDVAEEEEEAVLDDTESILEVCMRTYRPLRRLRWHYRSQHESLIAFSNSEFYQNDLIIVPSPTLGSESLGIRHHFVDGAHFSGRKNILEAQRVVQHVIQHVTRTPELSLGVGTFNVEQKELIEEILETVQKRDPRAARAIEKFNERYTHEPLFVKNLENLQGDERQVIFISCTYGPEPESGKVKQRFGPINHPQAWRRLNVLITRARVRVEVFTSMRAQDVLVEPSSTARGRVALRNYLEYVETGKWKDPGQVSERLPDSDFEVMVAEELRKHGYKCMPQVGVAGFFVDIGVLHPKYPNEFVLGIECDGASYHSQNSVRDRDRLRQEILEGRKWKIHRVWSTDWWTNPKNEVQRMLAAIEAAILEADSTPRPRIEHHDQSQQKSIEVPALKVPVATVFDDAKLADLLHRGISDESRVQTSALFASIASQLGLNELTSELWERLSELLEQECKKGCLQSAWGTVWRPKASPKASVVNMAVGSETKPAAGRSTITELAGQSVEPAKEAKVRSVAELAKDYTNQLPAYSRSAYRMAIEEFIKRWNINAVANLESVKSKDIAAHRESLCAQGLSERFIAQNINYLYGWFGWLQKQKVLKDIPFS
jgi:very-short-patch-repair endonuclease